MKVEVEYRIAMQSEIIDLTDYGYSEETNLIELTEEQRNEITDILRSENIVFVGLSQIGE